MPADVDRLPSRIHQRIGGGIDIQTFAEGTVEVGWRRAYGSELSQEGFVSAGGLAEAPQAVLQHEEDEDRADAAALAEEPR